MHGYGSAEMRGLGQEWTNLLLHAEQQEMQVGISLKRNLGAPDDHARGTIAAHRVEGDRDLLAHLVLPSPRSLLVSLSQFASASPLARRNTRTQHRGDADALARRNSDILHKQPA